MSFLVAATAQASYVFEFERVLNLGVEEGARVMPVAVTVDEAAGEVCVTDTRQLAFHLLNAQDVPVFRTSRLAQLSYPWDGSVDAQGRIVFTDRHQGTATIRRLNGFGEPDGYEPEPPTADWNPQHLIITRDGGYLTLDSRSNLLAKHDPETGALIWDRYVGLEDMPAEQIGRPAEAPDGRLYIPGGDMRRILVLEEDGSFVLAFGRFGSAPGRVSFPVSIAFAPDGAILVLDRVRAKVLVYDTDHDFVTEFGSLGFRPGRFYHPVSIAATDEGRVYVAQGYDGRVQVFRLARLAER